VTAADLERSQDDVVARPDLFALVEQARAGEEPAWESLYRMLYPRLVAYARRELGAEQAKEAVSETMARAVAGIDRFSWRGAGFEGWLFGILRHVIVDTHRRDSRQARTPVYRDGADGAQPDDGLVADEEARAVRAAFARLRPEEQELLHLRIVSGLSSEDVAGVLGKRPGTVRMAQSRALDRLRSFLQDGER
jgi:RNA polymerase sigma-70 factor, ECF subfamily